MRAEVLEPQATFEVQPETRQDGTTGPPDYVRLTVRPCWRKPAIEMLLEFIYELDGVAYYAVTRRPQ